MGNLAYVKKKQYFCSVFAKGTQNGRIAGQDIVGIASSGGTSGAAQVCRETAGRMAVRAACKDVR